MNMAASVAEASAEGNYKALAACHYRRLAEMARVALQLVDPSRLRAALVRQKVAEVSNLGGFSGSVFERVNPLLGENRFVIALRGTEAPRDHWRDVFPADFGDLIANGLAWKQIIDLHNWWSLRQAFVSGGERAISALRAHHQTLPALLRVTLLWPRLGSRRAALCQLRVELNVAGLTKRGFCFAPEKCD